MARSRIVHGSAEITRRSIFGCLASLPFIGHLFAAEKSSHSILRRFPPGHKILSAHMWYENADGKRFYPDLRAQPGCGRPDGYDYYVSRFPHEVRTEHYRMTKDGSSELLVAGSKTFPEDLVLALVQKHGYSLCEAILLACSCERCVNSLAHAVGLSWGYPEGSDQWLAAKTGCEWCREKRGVEGTQNKA